VDERTKDRFWAKVDRRSPDECWLWLASLKPSGYGQFRLNGKTAYGHRVAYELLIGPIPAGLSLDHLCRNTACVNPSHLEPVTHQENMSRGFFGAKTHCPKGHEYTEENTRVTGGIRPGRKCRTCDREWVRVRKGVA
jgi:hypothetical protein